MIPILGYALEVLPAGQISRHEKIVTVPFKLPISSKSSIVEEWSSKFFVDILISKKLFPINKSMAHLMIILLVISEDDFIDVNKDTMLETYHGVRINIQ